ncbi:YobI family P-loop NTPase [Acinetobacter soli]
MSKEKRQKIWNELKITFAKIKKIHSAPQITSTNQYLSLTPITSADEDNAYSDMLKFALSQNKTNNIAITGPYGSGKSSVLQTFQKKHPQWKYLNISLATFKDELEVENANSKEIEIEAIEKSILQQLFYSVDQKTLPRSRLKRIVTVKTRELIANTLFIFLWAFLALVVFFPQSIFFEKFSILASSDQLAITTASLLFLLFCIVGLFTGIKYIEKLKELKLKFQDTEITLNNEKSESILNKHLDEILYFFERTKFDVIIIEDLDRFENSEIFIRLRELNTLINNSKQVNRPIVFLYAIRDNMFKDKDRSKFFDFIIPIIPVINPTNAYDLIRKNYINEESDSQLHKEIEDVFLHQVSLYFDDMRLVTNIFNEFKIYIQKLKNPNLNKNKLLALIIYKNYYPAEFANLHSNKGEIYEIFTVKKKNIISHKLEAIKHEIVTLDEKIQASQLEKIETITELRKLYVYEILKRYPNITGASNSYNYIRSTSYLVKLKVGDSYLDHNNLTNDENFNTIQNSENIEWFVEITDHNRHTNIQIQNSQDIKFNFQTIQNIVNSTLSYKERESRIKNSEKMNRGKLLEQKQGLVNKRNYLKQNTLKELLTINSSEEFFESDIHPPLLQFLVREGYIDEHYSDYISFFIDSVINITERDYAQSVINHINSDFDITLTNVEKVLEKYLTPRQFLHTSILNFCLVDFILEKNSKFNDHQNNLFKLLSNQDDRSIQFIFEYIDRGENLSLFINKIVKSWQSFFEHIHTSMVAEKVESYLLLILKNLEKENISLLNKDDILKNYLSSKSNFIEYIKDAYSTEQEILNFLQLIKPVFEYLDCNNENDISIFNKICRNEYFEFNTKMILQIICINNEVQKIDEIQNIFASKPYGVLQDFSPDYLKTQVDQSINHFFENVYISSSENLSENSDNFIKLINNENLDNSHKEWLIKNNEVKISDLSEIAEKALWKFLITNMRILPNWNSLIIYFTHKEFHIDSTIINYLNSPEVYDNLGKIKIFDSASAKNDDDLGIKFESSLLQSEKLNLNAYNSIIKAHKYSYSNLDISDLSNEKTLVLCQNKILSFTDTNLTRIRNKSNDVLVEFLSQNTKHLLEKVPTELEITNDEFELILASNKFTIQFKKAIVDKLNIDLFSKSENIRLLIINVYNQLSEKIPIDYIDYYFENSISLSKTIDLFISQIKHLDKINITKYLNSLGTPYKEITNPNRQKLNFTQQHDKLTTELELIGYIHKKEIKKYKFAENKIFFYLK